MKNVPLILMLTIMTTQTISAQTDKVLIEQTITHFVKAADERNFGELETLLHNDFRVVLNQLMGSSEVNILTKPLYLSMAKEGKIGGDKRKVKILSVDVIQNNASVRAIFEGQALRFESFFHLIKTKEGNWMLLEDLPYATIVQAN